jgi:cytochrome c-type biogenesis protein CcmH/NrfG
VRFFVAFAICIFFAAVFSTRAQQSADDDYLLVYSHIQQGDARQTAGDSQSALTEFTQAQNGLQRFQRIYPSWNPKIVNFRLNYVADKIAELTPQTIPTNAPSQTATAAGNSTNATPSVSSEELAKWHGQLNALQQQLRESQSDNSTLAAKLKEALAAQPAAIDPRELAKAQQQIRQLMKENDLLKASVRTGEPESVAPTNAFADLQSALTAADKKLADALEREKKLAAENQALQGRVRELLATPRAMEALRQENELLKKQVAELKMSATNSEIVAQLTLQLSEARGEIAMLKSNAEITSIEKMALQQRIRQLQLASPPPDQKASEEKIKSLMNERDELLVKLDTANKKLYGGKKEDAIAKIDQLQGEVNRLRARLDIAEARLIPFTPEESELFKPAPKLVVNPSAEKKGISEMPGGSAALVAEAQRHFSAGQYDEAENSYMKILQRDQNNGLALANLATIELRQDKLDDADKHITAALAQSPDDAYNLLVLGEVKFSQRKFDDALDALGHAAKMDPQNPEIENVIGATLAQKGMRAQAETAFRKAVQLDPKYGDAHKNLAVIYISQQPPMTALAKWHYQKAIDAGVPRSLDLEKMLQNKGAVTNQ